MANRWKGNFVVATAATSSGTDYTGKANGAWGLNSQLQQKQGGLWAKGVYPPSAPTSVVGGPGNASANISFTASADSGGGAISSYTATSTPSGITSSASTSPIIVNGLTNGTSYTFTVKATTQFGVSNESNPSNSVTPSNFNAALAVGHDTSPFISVYKWATGNGFGTKYADPSVSLTTFARVSFNPTNTVLATSSQSSASTNIKAFAWNNETGFGTIFSSPASIPTGSTYYNSFNKDGSVFAVGHANSPFISAYAWSNGFGTKYADPSTLPTDNGRTISFTSTDIMAVCYGSPGVIAYPFNTSTGFGTKYADPSTAYDFGLGGSFSLTENLVSLVGAPSFTILAVYQWTNGTGFGSKYTNPATLPPNNTYASKFSKTTNKLAVSFLNNSSPSMYVYNWSSGFGTLLSGSSTPLTGTSYANFWSNTLTSDNKDELAVTSAVTPFIAVYPIDSSIGTRYSNPITLPTGTGFSVSFTN